MSLLLPTVINEMLAMLIPDVMTCILAMIIMDSLYIIKRKFIMPMLDSTFPNTTLNWLFTEYESFIITPIFIVISTIYHPNYWKLYDDDHFQREYVSSLLMQYFYVVHLIALVLNLCMWKLISYTLKGFRKLLTNETSVSASNTKQLSAPTKSHEYSRTEPKHGEKTLFGALVGIVNASIWLLDEQDERFDDTLTKLLSGPSTEKAN